MTFTFDLRDIDGQPIDVGNRVCGYAQEYDEVSRDGSGDVLVVEEDRSRPRPIKDIPLFLGVVAWNPEMLMLEVIIEHVMVDWELRPSRVQMGGGHYAYQVVTPDCGVSFDPTEARN